MNKTATSLLLTLLLISVVSAQETPDPVRTNLQDIEYKQLLVQQQAKIQLDMRNELDKNNAELETKIYAYVDENFQVLDGRINDFVTKATFKLGMAFLSATVLGGTILMLINNRINRKRAIKKRLDQTGESLILSGQTLNKIREEQEVVIPSPTPDDKPKKKNATPKITPTNTNTYSDLTIKPMGEQ